MLNELSLWEAIQLASQQWTAITHIPVKYELDGQASLLSDAGRQTIFQVLQESLANVKKHSDATQVSITIRYTEAHVHFQVEDNGRGFDCEQLQMHGQGLDMMRYRIIQVHGNLTIDSKIGNGTTITAVLPIDCE